MLPSPWNNPTNVLLTGATIRKPLAGIYTEPNVICECIRNTFELTADKKIAHLRIPVIGSGHGGLEINSAILFILLSIGHYSKKFHHIKSIEIVIIDSDAKKIKDIYKLQLLHDLEGDSL